MSKLDELADLCGMDEMDMLEEGIMDSIVWGICVNEGCDFINQVEPDQHTGFCENCEEQTVQSCMVLAGII